MALPGILLSTWVLAAGSAPQDVLVLERVPPGPQRKSVVMTLSRQGDKLFCQTDLVPLHEIRPWRGLDPALPRQNELISPDCETVLTRNQTQRICYVPRRDLRLDELIALCTSV
jgi:hypothetical protein